MLENLLAERRSIYCNLSRVEDQRNRLLQQQDEIERKITEWCKAHAAQQDDYTPPTTRTRFYTANKESTHQNKGAAAAYAGEETETREYTDHDSLDSTPLYASPAERNLSFDTTDNDAPEATIDPDVDFEGAVKAMFYAEIDAHWVFQRCGKVISKGVRKLLGLPEKNDVDIKVSKLNKGNEFHFNQIRIYKAAQIFLALDETTDKLQAFYIPATPMERLIEDFGQYSQSNIAQSGSIADRGLDEELTYSLHPCIVEPTKVTKRGLPKPVRCWKQLQIFEVKPNELPALMIRDGHSIPA
jgi:hypothetical protein